MMRLTALQPRATISANDGEPGMIDNFSLALSHGLILLAMWRLFLRPDLDSDDLPPPAIGDAQGKGIPNPFRRRGGA
jgi:hypothetical protein